MKNNIETIERCSNLMADYKERFGKNVPIQILFYNMETICMLIEKALEADKEIEVSKE